MAKKSRQKKMKELKNRVLGQTPGARIKKATQTLVSKVNEVKDEVQDKTVEVSTALADKVIEVKDSLQEKATDMKEAVDEKVAEARENIAQRKADEADNLFEGIRDNIRQILVEAGFATKADLAKVSEATILAIKGIGKTTVEKLKENGVSFKD